MTTLQWIIATLHEVGEKNHCTVLRDDSLRGTVLTYMHKDVYEATLQVGVQVDLGVFMLSAARPRTGQKIDTVTGRWDDSLASMQAQLGSVHGQFGAFVEQVHELLQSGDVPFDVAAKGVNWSQFFNAAHTEGEKP